MKIGYAAALAALLSAGICARAEIVNISTDSNSLVLDAVAAQLYITVTG